MVDNEKLLINIVNYAYVDPEGSDDNTGVSWDSPFKTIQHAMEIVLANGRIYLSDGTHKVDNLISIDKTVTIIGNGTKTLITNNKNNKGVFNVTANNVAIYNSTFANNTANIGGAILNSGNGLTVSGCSFVNNSATYGGAIGNLGKNLTVSNSIFINNKATTNGSAIYTGYSCIANDNWWGNNTPNWDKLVKTYISAKVAHESYAVLSLTATNNNVTINFYKNGTNEVLKIPTRSLNLTIDNQEYPSEITNGTFKQDYTAPAGEYNITAVVDNQKLTISFLKNVYVDPEGSDDNTGADWNNAVKTIEHAMEIVLANGKIYLADGTHEVDSQITIGKTVAIVGNGTKTLITNNKNNKGVFNVTANNVAIYNSTFANNTANIGGAILNSGNSLTVSGCSFVNNSAQYGGGAISNSGASNCTVSNSKFEDNSASNAVVIYNGCYSSSDGYFYATINLNNNSYSGIGEGKVCICMGYGSYDGAILTPVIITVLENKTISAKNCESVMLVATITTEDGASVAGGTLNFIVNGTKQSTSATSNDDGNYTLSYTVPNVGGRYLVNVSYMNANNVTAETGVLNVGKLYDIYVDYNNGDNKRDGSSWIDAVQTIEHAMEIVPEGCIIHLADGTHIVNTQIAIDKAVTIIGNSTKTLITNNGNGRGVFKVITDGVNIFNSTFINSTGEYGGVIENYSGNLSIINTTFNNNTADNGVTIYKTYNGANNLTVQTSTINSSRVTTKVNITLVNDIIDYGENATINIKVNTTTSDIVSGNVTINVDGREYDGVNLTNVSLELSIPGLSAGKHIIIVTYNGNDTYNTSTSNVTVNVKSIAPTININTTNMIYGEKALS